MSADLEGPRQGAPPGTTPAAPGRGAKAAVGTLLVLGALTWVFFLVRPSLFPPRRVATAPVRLEEGASRAAGVVEAAGWIEPDPFAVDVRPLVDGIVESVEVVEARPVKAGETVIARLRNAALEGDVERARSEVKLAKARVPEAQAEVDMAVRSLEQRLDLRREVARLDGEVDLAVAEKASAEAEVALAERGVASAEADVEAQAALDRGGGGVAGAQAKARAALEAAQATLGERRARAARAQAARATAQALRALAREGLEHPVALEVAVPRAQARLAAVEAERDRAETALAVLERQVGWLVVKSPVDGVVLRRNAAPGSRVGPSVVPRGSDPAAGSEGTLVSIYDPAHLEARIDVLLGSARGVGVDQRPELTLDAIPGKTFHGVVTRVASPAGPLERTLEVKIRVEDPDPTMKPEMRVRARFLTPAPNAGDAEGAVRVLVPRRAVRDGAVYVLDPRRGGRARRVPVTVGAAEGDLVEVAGDLRAAQSVILDPVEDDERVVGGAP